MFLVYKRTKWKRQATVGIELLTEAGNIAAMQSLCARLPWMHHHPPPPALTPPASSSIASLGTNMDFYYRHAAALATLRPPPFVSAWNGSASAEKNEETSEAAEDKLLDQDKS